MRRFTDPLLFFFLLLLAVIAWAVMAWQNAIPVSSGREMAPMTVAVVVVIACPALAFLTIVALVRALFQLNPRRFWSVMMIATLTGAMMVLLTILVTRSQDLELGFETTMWLLGIAALGSFVALVLAFTGAIPVPEQGEDKTNEPVKVKKSKRERKVAPPAAKQLAPVDTDSGMREIETAAELPGGEHDVTQVQSLDESVSAGTGFEEPKREANPFDH